MLPPFLKIDDQIRIISPSSCINPEYIDGAIKELTDWGLHVSEGKYARAKYGRFAGTPEQRIEDLQLALDDPTVKAILCSRGGYGISQIIDKIDFRNFIKSPKWTIGFSDITILHNAITNNGIASLHSVMAKHLTEKTSNDEPVQQLKNILSGELPTYSILPHTLNKNGKSSGKLIGGNLSVLMGLRGSQYDLDYSNAILFIEDIDETPYKIDRMIQNLRFSGVFSKLSGLIVGQFSDCEEDPEMKQSILEIISFAIKEYDFPVCFNFPAGHVEYNLPVILGKNIQLDVNQTEVRIQF